MRRTIVIHQLVLKNDQVVLMQSSANRAICRHQMIHAHELRLVSSAEFATASRSLALRRALPHPLRVRVSPFLCNLCPRTRASTSNITLVRSPGPYTPLPRACSHPRCCSRSPRQGRGGVASPTPTVAADKTSTTVAGKARPSPPARACPRSHSRHAQRQDSRTPVQRLDRVACRGVWVRV